MLEQLATISSALQEEVDKLNENQARTQLEVQELRASQNDLLDRYISNSRDIQALRSEFFFKSDKQDVNVFHAPDTFSWFTGRTSQVEEIEAILKKNEQLSQSSARKVAICGLGGSGKTSLAVEYAHRMKGHYQGGVFWFSGEDEKKLENSVNNLALSIGTFVSNSFDVTLSRTLARMSRVQKPWLLIIDDMDELQLSPNVRKLLSGSWQKKCNGHIIVTTRRKPSTLVNDVQVPEINENCCLELQCFDVDDAKEFLFTRTGIPRNDDTEAAAYKLFEDLGGLPLALEQAAAYIKFLGCPFSSYVETYKTKRLALLNQQRINPVSEYSSPERLAVQTTWLLNIDYIKWNSEGRNTIRFLNACLFFSPNEIQEELINIGEPPVNDKQFRIFVGTSLGRYQIFKFLTDFSLFKQSSSRCLQVHRLVLDVIKESLSSSEQEESFVDAVRLLQHSLSKSYSPDELLSSVADRRRNLVDYNNPSLFYMWRTLCMHAGEIEKNLKNFLLDQCDNMKRPVFLPETARVVYQYALYLSVFCRHEEAMQAMNFAVKILDWLPDDQSELLSAKPLNSLFPHAFPLPEFIRRHVQYCSKAPAVSSHKAEECVDSSTEEENVEIEKLREEGNRLFLEGRFQEAIQVYSSAIDKTKEFPDPRFFSNRASAYLRLQLYEKALEDAKAYISRSPKCWKGYARKALALHGLNDELGAELAASQTYNLARDVFSKYDLFKKFSYLKKCARFCYSVSDLLHALNDMTPGKRVIFLYPGAYEIAGAVVFDNCIVLGCGHQAQDSRIRVSVKDNSTVLVNRKCSLANLSFQFDQGNTNLPQTSATLLYNCGFSSRNLSYPALDAAGVTKVENCDFRNSGAGGFLCVGAANVENCTFSNNGKAGLEVREGGTLVAKNVYSYNNNKQGLKVGPQAKTCVLRNSQINCNAGEGIFVNDCDHDDADIKLSNNSIFHNDNFGISVRNSSASITENRVFENSQWGIWLQTNSCCQISKNEVSGNRVGGIRIGKRPSGWAPSVVEYNKINDNVGPALIENINAFDVNIFLEKQVFPVDMDVAYQCDVPLIPPDLENTLVSAQCRENIRNRNEVEYAQTQPSNPPKVDKFCSYCRVKGTLKKCTKCYVADYCGRACQKKHWKRHKTMCKSLLEQSGILLTSTERACGSSSKGKNMVGLNFHHRRLEEVGPNYSEPPPENGERFIVKVQLGHDLFDSTSTHLVVYDRSLAINESFQSAHVQNLIRDLGAICESKYTEKKLFMWAAYTENKVIRLFTNDFPPYQPW